MSASCSIRSKASASHRRTSSQRSSPRTKSSARRHLSPTPSANCSRPRWTAARHRTKSTAPWNGPAIGRLVAEERRGLNQRLEPELLKVFGERLDDGGADACLDLLRPQFEDASLALRDSLSIVNIGADPTDFLQTATAEQLNAYQILPKVVSVLDRIGGIVAAFGPGAHFPVAEDPRDIDPGLQCGWLHPVAVMCTSGALQQACMAFQQPHPHGDLRSSPWLRTVPFLHSVDSARERVRSWAETAWAAEESGHPREGRLIGLEVVDDPPRRNPFTTRAEARA
jgi:hypothetical protein